MSSSYVFLKQQLKNDSAIRDDCGDDPSETSACCEWQNGSGEIESNLVAQHCCLIECY